jgi:hypothetical protein
MFYSSPETNVLYPNVDLRTTKEKIESLEKEMKLHAEDSTVFISQLYLD